MAFTQKRAIEILNAANDYRQALLALTEHIKTQFSQAEITQEWKAFAFSVSNYTIPAFLMRDPVESNSVLTRETEHFRRNQLRNDAARLRMARKYQATSKRPYKQVISADMSPIVTPPAIPSNLCKLCQSPLDNPQCGLTAAQIDACPHNKPFFKEE